MHLPLTPAPPQPSSRSGLLDRVLGGIERVGNRLPHPFFLFVGIFAILAVISTVLEATGAQVTVPGSDETVVVKGLLSGDGAVWLLENLITNFTGFAALGTVLLMMMAVGVAERTGLLDTIVRATVARAPAPVLPYAVAFVSCQAHLMSDIALLVIPPLAALAFKSAGRNPVAGLIGAFACVCSGYSAGFTIGALDALYVGITEQAVKALPQGAEAVTHILVNYFYTAAASIVLAALGGFLISRVLEPRLPRPQASDEAETTETLKLTSAQRRGLLLSGLAVSAYIGAVLLVWLMPDSPLRGEGGALVPSPVLSGVVPLLFVAFVLAGVVYGVTARTLTKAADVPKMMTESVTSMSGYIVLIFAIGQVIAFFNWSGVGTLLAVKSAALLESAGLTGLTGVIVFVLLVCLLNIFITSGSALWSLMAPVFVPAFMLIGLEPAFIQAAFRIGDSGTQMITPMNPFLLLALALLRQYEPEARLGTLMARLSIFVVPFIVAWLALLSIFYAFDLPLGPGAVIHTPS
ncbi:AbgT family transporter [Streptomyces sp. LARHCF252]